MQNRPGIAGLDCLGSGRGTSRHRHFFKWLASIHRITFTHIHPRNISSFACLPAKLDAPCSARLLVLWGAWMLDWQPDIGEIG